MISREEMEMHPEVDWSVYKRQQSIPASELKEASFNEEPVDKYRTNFPIGQSPKKGKTVNTFLGAMPSPEEFKKFINDPNTINEMTMAATGGPGIKLVGELGAASKAGISKLSNYLHPETPGKLAEEFRSSLGQGTSAENIEELGKRAQFAKESTKQESLIPKEEIYSKEAKSDIYGQHNPKEQSSYFNNSDVTAPYYKDSKLDRAHKAYEEKPILDNYDALQSAIKKEMRRISDKSSGRYHQLEMNAENLNKDKEAFTSTLPEDLQNRENEFRSKYRQFAETYEKPAPGKKDVGASLTLRRLASGKHNLVTDEQIASVFGNPTAADKRIIADMGPTAARNALYAALQRVRPNDAKGMANTVLELKRTKGFDNIVTPEMESWAHNIMAHINRSESIRKGLGIAGNVGTHLGTIGVGGLLGGGAGLLAGAILPTLVRGSAKGAKYIAEKVRK